MGQFYDKITDEQRIFLFLYYKKYTFEAEYDDGVPRTMLWPKVSEIRKKTKSFDKDDISNEQFKQNFIDLEYCRDNGANYDDISIYELLFDEIKEKIDKIYTVFLSSEFLVFLNEQQMFDEKRCIVDFIAKSNSDINNNNFRESKNKFIEFVVDNFNILGNLFLQHKGKMIF